jgi:nucleotide-binding universal stress UspA family protein
MTNIRKILLPVDFPNVSLGVIHQSATLAHHFNAQIVMIHVVTPRNRSAGVPYPGRGLDNRDLLAAILEEARKQQDQSLGPELEGLSIQFIVGEGDPATAVIHTAEEQNADLIMMSSHGLTFDQFLLGSVTAKVLHRTECPVWTSEHVEETALQPFAIHNVLCAVDLGLRSGKAVGWASEISAKFGARLTLAHVTAGIELWGPGGWCVDQEWKDALVRDATRRIAKLEQDTGIKADVFIGSGDVPKVLRQAVQQTKADLLVTGCYPYGGNLTTHGYGIICAVPVPVLSV